jgi:hypothetical protein
MKQTLYYRNVMRRRSVVLERFYDFVVGMASIPRMMLEVFIRRNFGERYFKLPVALFFAVLIYFLPALIHFIELLLFDMSGGYDDEFLERPMQIKKSGINPYLTWYIYIAAFIGFSILRYREVRRNPSVFDFARYSLYGGDINPIFYKVKILGKTPSVRTVETYLEPLPFLLLGVLLWLLGQKLGILLTVFSLFYSFSYMAAYYAGDNFVMDKIDQKIISEELSATFLRGEHENEKRGFRFLGDIPESEETRRKILPLLADEEPAGTVS